MPTSAVALRPVIRETDLLEPIRDMSHALIHRLNPLLEPSGLAPSTFWPLHHLYQGRERHPGELARRLGITPAACTALVDQLVDAGYVLRRPSQRDRRQVVLEVTPKGQRKIEAIWRGFGTTLRDVLEGVPPEDLATTARTMRSIASRLRELDAGPEAHP